MNGNIIKLLVPACALALSLILGGLFMYAIGVDPVFIYGRIATETLGNLYGLGQVLFKSTTFIFTGLAAALAFRTGLFNIGAEGQLIMGAFAMSYIGVACAGLPPLVLLPLCLACGFFAGSVWAAVPGVLKSKYGAHEVITTIMMNFIAAALVSYWINNVFGVPATVHTAPIAPSATLFRLDAFFPQLRGSPVNLSFVFAFLAAIILQFFISRTRMGYELRTAGLSKDAASYAGIPVASRSLLALALSGGLAGIGGSNFVLGYKHYYEIGFSDGAGFMGIAVALLAKNNPLAIILTAIFFGTLEYGGLTINTYVPKELVNILQAIIILCTIIFTKVFDKMILHGLQRRATEQRYA